MFFDIGVKDIIDVLLVAFLLYYTYKLMKASGSINVFTGILIFILIWLVVSQVLEMKLLGSIFDKLVSVGVVALITLSPYHYFFALPPQFSPFLRLRVHHVPEEYQLLSTGK